MRAIILILILCCVMGYMGFGVLIKGIGMLLVGVLGLIAVIAVIGLIAYHVVRRVTRGTPEA